jgi:hypothetical protein
MLGRVKDKSVTAMPTAAHVIVDLPASVFSVSPPAVKYCHPAQRNIITAIAPINAPMVPATLFVINSKKSLQSRRPGIPGGA